MPNQATQKTNPREGPARHDRDEMARAFDAFRDPDSPFSQRQYANEHGLPRSTLGDWLRQEAPSDLEADVKAGLFRRDLYYRLIGDAAPPPGLSGVGHSTAGYAGAREIVYALRDGLRDDLDAAPVRLGL